MKAFWYEQLWLWLGGQWRLKRWIAHKYDERKKKALIEEDREMLEALR